MFIGIHGYPIIAYETEGDYRELRVAKCDSHDCSSREVNIVWGHDFPVHRFNPHIIASRYRTPAIAVNTDGSVDGIALILCNDLACADFDESANLVLDRGYRSVVTLDEDGNPVIAAAAFNQDTFEDDLYISRCSNPECSGFVSEVIQKP